MPNEEFESRLKEWRQEECDFEYPKGRFMRSNNWRFDLSTDGLFD